MRGVLAVAVATMVLSGCGKAAADTPNPDSDIDCAIITGAFAEGARQENVPEMQQVALALSAKWYSAEINRTGEVNSPAFTDEYVKSTTAKLNSDMKGAKDKMLACIARAERDPRFETFARASGWQGRI